MVVEGYSRSIVQPDCCLVGPGAARREFFGGRVWGGTELRRTPWWREVSKNPSVREKGRVGLDGVLGNRLRPVTTVQGPRRRGRRRTGRSGGALPRTDGVGLAQCPRTRRADSGVRSGVQPGLAVANGRRARNQRAERRRPTASTRRDGGTERPRSDASAESKVRFPPQCSSATRGARGRGIA